MYEPEGDTVGDGSKGDGAIDLLRVPCPSHSDKQRYVSCFVKKATELLLSWTGG